MEGMVSSIMSFESQNRLSRTRHSMKGRDYFYFLMFLCQEASLPIGFTEESISGYHPRAHINESLLAARELSKGVRCREWRRERAWGCPSTGVSGLVLAPAPLHPAPQGLVEALPAPQGPAALWRALAKATLISWFMRSCKASLGEKDRQE